MTPPNTSRNINIRSSGTVSSCNSGLVGFSERTTWGQWARRILIIIGRDKIRLARSGTHLGSRQLRHIRLLDISDDANRRDWTNVYHCGSHSSMHINFRYREMIVRATWKKIRERSTWKEFFSAHSRCSIWSIRQNVINKFLDVFKIAFPAWEHCVS